MTKARTAAMEALDRAPGPLTAAESYSSIDLAYDQATVYRAD